MSDHLLYAFAIGMLFSIVAAIIYIITKTPLPN